MIELRTNTITADNTMGIHSETRGTILPPLDPAMTPRDVGRPAGARSRRERQSREEKRHREAPTVRRALLSFTTVLTIMQARAGRRLHGAPGIPPRHPGRRVQGQCRASPRAGGRVATPSG